MVDTVNEKPTQGELGLIDVPPQEPLGKAEFAAVNELVRKISASGADTSSLVKSNLPEILPENGSVQYVLSIGRPKEGESYFYLSYHDILVRDESEEEVYSLIEERTREAVGDDELLSVRKGILVFREQQGRTDNKSGLVREGIGEAVALGSESALHVALQVVNHEPIVIH